MVLGINERAWSGINIVVLGHTPMLPMKIEQSLAMASPANEVKFDSFETYEQAYDFCKDQKTVGLIFLQESATQLSSADTFRQLALHYESKGWPCFGVLVYEKEKSLNGYLSLQKNKNFLAYISADELLNKAYIASTMNEVWNRFVQAFEEAVIPQKLQETLVSMAEPDLSADSLGFRFRLATMLSQGLNISWLEMIALRWQPVVATLEKTNPLALKPNDALVQLAALATPEIVANDLASIAKLKISLCQRLALTIDVLDKARSFGTIAAEIVGAENLIGPGASAILKQIVKSKDQIKIIASEYEAKGLRLVV